jgi:hypothetical protein
MERRFASMVSIDSSLENTGPERESMASTGLAPSMASRGFEWFAEEMVFGTLGRIWHREEMRGCAPLVSGRTEQVTLASDSVVGMQGLC